MVGMAGVWWRVAGTSKQEGWCDPMGPGASFSTVLGGSRGAPVLCAWWQTPVSLADVACLVADEIMSQLGFGRAELHPAD